MLSPASVAALLGVSVRHVRRLVSTGTLRPSFRLSHRVVRIPESAVQRLIARA
jgi:excisionase family DNA binding protein